MEWLAPHGFVGRSSVLLEELGKIPLFASCDASVMITGETGTGKGLCARAIHNLSSRRDKPFVPVTCGAIPQQLLKNELFGHEKGAFTGAVEAFPGLVAQADGGTLFLDEMDSMPLDCQVMLLQLLCDKEYRRLGSQCSYKADVRVIAAIQCDNAKAAWQGRLREDLMFRLNVMQLAMPPLRQRDGDVPILACHFLRESCERFERSIKGFSNAAMETLCRYTWPGNIRELQNVVDQAVVLTRTEMIDVDSLRIAPPTGLTSGTSFKARKQVWIADFETQYLRDALAQHQGDVRQAARAAQMNPKAFWNLMRKRGVEPWPKRAIQSVLLLLELGNSLFPGPVPF